MIKVFVNGCNGKMGHVLIQEMDRYDDLLLVGGFDRNDIGLSTFPVYSDIHSTIEERPDVIIDFSVPLATLTILTYAKKEKIPMVIATTGFSEDQEKKLQEAAEQIPIFKSSNMSFDINLMNRLVAKLAVLLKGTDIEIIESHHNRKIDSPSGTAMTLANCINKALDNEMHLTFNRHDNHEKRDPNEIGMSSIRGGNIVGEHTVQFIGEHETFEITHKAYSRSVFAEGALKAAQFIYDKPNGMYGMEDLMNDSNT